MIHRIRRDYSTLSRRMVADATTPTSYNKKVDKFFVAFDKLLMMAKELGDEAYEGHKRAERKGEYTDYQDLAFVWGDIARNLSKEKERLESGKYIPESYHVKSY